MAKAQEKEPTPDETLDALMDRINAKAKHRVIARAGQVPNPYFLRRPSGIMPLDADTGGGLPAGGCSVISGPDGAGKTYLTLQYMRMQQYLLGHNARLAMACVEFLPDHWYWRDCGLWVAIPDEMIEERQAWLKDRGLAQLDKETIKNLKTQVGRIDIITGATAEETMQSVLDMYATKLYQIIAVDSVSVLLADDDADKDLDKRDARAANANLLTSFQKKYHPLTLGLDDDPNAATLIFISQVRANQQKSEAPAHIQKYLPDWAPTGARAVRHGKLVDICLSVGERVKKTVAGRPVSEEEAAKEAAKKIQTGKVMRYEIIKGKCGTHDGIKGGFDYDYKGKVDIAQTVLDMASELGLVAEQRGGLMIRQYNTDQVIVPPTSRKALMEALNTDFALQVRVRMEVLAARGIQCRYL